MARIRSVKPEFWDDRKLAKRASRDARLLYIGLWNLADEHARLNGDPLWIKGKIFPYDDDVDVKAIVALLDELASPALGSVVRYEVDDDPYIFLPKLARHQRLEPHKVDSRIPPPPPGLGGHPSEPGSDQSERRTDKLPFGSEDTEPGRDDSGPDADESAPFYVAGSMEHVAGSMSGGAQRRATRIPDGFTPTAEMAAWCRAECPNVNGRRETEKFTDYWQAKPGKAALKLDWVKTWKNWMRTAEDHAPRIRGTPSAQPPVGHRQAADDAMFDGALARARERDAAQGRHP